jgi:hypothetical protein
MTRNGDGRRTSVVIRGSCTRFKGADQRGVHAMSPPTSRTHVPRIDVAAKLHACVPIDDHRVASTLRSGVIEHAVTMSEALRELADGHFDGAPASSLHVLELNGAITRAVLDWIERWPR